MHNTGDSIDERDRTEIYFISEFDKIEHCKSYKGKGLIS